MMRRMQGESPIGSCESIAGVAQTLSASERLVVSVLDTFLKVVSDDSVVALSRLKGQTLGLGLDDDSPIGPEHEHIDLTELVGGDVQGAWDQAVAAWIRSRLIDGGAPDLRADLDRLMTQAVIPERARLQKDADAARTLREAWESIKEQWK